MALILATFHHFIPILDPSRPPLHRHLPRPRFRGKEYISLRLVRLPLDMALLVRGVPVLTAIPDRLGGICSSKSH